MDPLTMIPTIAAHLHVAPATLVFWFFLLNLGAKALARRIPNDAVGFWGFVRQTAAIVGVENSSRVTANLTVADAAKAVVTSPALAEHVIAVKEQGK